LTIYFRLGEISYHLQYTGNFVHKTGKREVKKFTKSRGFLKRDPGFQTLVLTLKTVGRKCWLVGAYTWSNI